MPKEKMVAVNDRGHRIGESHPRAKISDHEVDLLRDLIESLIKEGKRPMEAYRLAAEKFETSARYVGKIVRCERRGHTVAGHRRVKDRVAA